MTARIVKWHFGVIATVTKAVNIGNLNSNFTKLYNFCCEASYKYDLKLINLFGKVCLLGSADSDMASKQAIRDSGATVSMFRDISETEPSSYKAGALM